MGVVEFPIVFTPALQTGRVRLNNDGNMPAYPVITLRGRLTNPVVQNETTGESFSLDYLLAAGLTVVIDTRPGQRAARLGNGVNLAEHIEDGSKWPSMLPGLNDFRLTTDDTNDDGTMDVSWVPSYSQV